MSKVGVDATSGNTSAARRLGTTSRIMADTISGCTSGGHRQETLSRKSSPFRRLTARAGAASCGTGAAGTTDVWIAETQAGNEWSAEVDSIGTAPLSVEVLSVEAGRVRVCPTRLEQAHQEKGQLRRRQVQHKRARSQSEQGSSLHVKFRRPRRDRWHIRVGSITL